MVTLKEITEVLKKLRSNIERLNYLKKILEEVDNKELKQNIKELIKDIKELEAVAQIEVRGKVDWSLPEEEPKEERRLERQVVGIPMGREEEEKEVKVDYGLQSGVDLYRGRERESEGVGYESRNVRMDIDERKPFIEKNPNVIEGRVDQQFIGEDIKEHGEEVMDNRYEHSQRSSDYAPASVSQEVHEKARKKHLH